MPATASSGNSKAPVRRAAGHYCVRCHTPWALQGRREESMHPAGARIIAWVVSCRFCDYRRSSLTVVDVGSRLITYPGDGAPDYDGSTADAG